MRPSPCRQPVADEDLLAWWTREIEGAAARWIEEHLMACQSCTARGETLAALAGAVGDAVRGGAVSSVVTRGVLEGLRRDGRRVREYRVPAGGSVQCTVAPDDDVVAASLGVPGLPAGRVDLVVRTGDGPETRLLDVPHAAGAEEVILLPDVAELKSMPAHVQHVRLVLVSAAGERPLGEYRFDHSPWSA